MISKCPDMESTQVICIPIGLTLVPKNCAALPQNWKMEMPRARWAYGKISMRYAALC